MNKGTSAPTRSNYPMAGKHMLLMVLCCAIPLVGIALLAFLGVSNNYLAYGMILLCPLLHFFMMRDMHGTGHSGKHTAAESEIAGEVDT
ncbi:MAG: DUF2933 domain-containing protein [Methanolobus sp.]|nr:DUF2933 domain-containing protein [Methanolobus sp.]